MTSRTHARQPARLRPSLLNSPAAGILAGLLACATITGAAMTGVAAPAPQPAAAPEAKAPVDINTASEAELVTLPRVGPALAKRIVEHRKAAGGFGKVDELANVKGIGERTLTLLRPLVTASPLAKAVPAAAQGRP